METKKYKLTDETMTIYGRTLYRIEALRDFSDVKKGDKGGYIEKEENLSQNGNCWVYDDAMVYGTARVYDNAIVYGNSEVYGKAEVYHNAVVCGNAEIYGKAKVFGHARVYGDAVVYGTARVYDNAKVYDYAEVYDKAWVYGNAEVFNNAQVYCNALVIDNARVYGKAEVYHNARIFGNAEVFGNAEIRGDAEIASNSDYIVFKNWWSSGRYFTWTKNNNMWKVGCFYGTGEQLIEKAYKDSELSGKEYKKVVVYVNSIKDNKYNHVRKNIKERLLSKIRKLFGK